MKTRLLLNLLILIILALIISSGCGGNDGITQPLSISTPTTNPSDFGYLTITVVWPDRQPTFNEFILSSSEDGKNLIASAPYGTSSIVVKIYDPNDTSTLPDGTTRMPLENGTYTFNWIGPKAQETKVFGPIPAIEVKIVAEAWMGPGNELPGTIGGEKLSWIDTTVQIKPGMNPVDLNLGDHVMWANVRTPAPGETGDAAIDVNLSIDFQSTTESSSLNALDSPTATPVPSPVPQGGRKIKFTVESVTYTGTDNVIVTPADIHVDPELTTDPNGNCTALVRADKKPVKAVIKATLVGLDGQDTDISKTCEVNLGNLYKLSVTASPDSITTESHGSKSADDSNSNKNNNHTKILSALDSRPTQSDITARLMTADPVPEPVAGKLINFTILQNNGTESIGTLDSNQAETDPNGYCTVHFMSSETGESIIRASFQSDPNDPASTACTAECTVKVETYILFLDADCEIKCQSNLNDPNTITIYRDCTVVNKPIPVTATLLCTRGSYNSEPVPNKNIIFTVTGSATESTSNMNGITDPDGTCKITVPGGNKKGFIYISAVAYDSENDSVELASGGSAVDIGDYSLSFGRPHLWHEFWETALPDGSWRMVLNDDRGHEGLRLYCGTKIDTNNYGFLPLANQNVTFSITEKFQISGISATLYSVLSERIDADCNTDSTGDGSGVYNLVLRALFDYGNYNFPRTHVTVQAKWLTPSGETITKDFTEEFYPQYM